MVVEEMTTRLRDSMFINTAKNACDENALQYHNWSHVLDVLKVGQELYGERYNEFALEFEIAAAYHDSVYDSMPNKEFRSAQYMMRMFYHSSAFECLAIGLDTLEKAHTMIMATTNHRLADWPEYTWPLIEADLYGLTNINTARVNFYRIFDESMSLYKGLTTYDFAIKTRTFMTKLRDIAVDNRRTSGYNEYWDRVLNGIDETYSLSRDMSNWRR